MEVNGKLKIDNIGSGTSIYNLGIDAGGTVVAGVTGSSGGTGTITGATNGLHTVGVDVVLGGTLTGDTIVDLDSNSMEFNGGVDVVTLNPNGIMLYNDDEINSNTKVNLLGDKTKIETINTATTTTTKLTVLSSSVIINDILNINPITGFTGTAVEGDIYADSTTHKLRYYNGTTWNDLF